MMTEDERAALRAAARKGPYRRGSPEWEERECARMALGNQCLSFGAIGASNPAPSVMGRGKRKSIHYHYMLKKENNDVT